MVRVEAVRVPVEAELIEYPRGVAACRTGSLHVVHERCCRSVVGEWAPATPCRRSCRTTPSSYALPSRTSTDCLRRRASHYDRAATPFPLNKSITAPPPNRCPSLINHVQLQNFDL